MKRTDARVWLLAAFASLALAVPAQAVYHLAGTIDLASTTKNFGFSDAPNAAFAVDRDGNVFALNQSPPWITKYAPTGQQLVSFGSADQIEEPKGIATDSAGGVYVSDKYKVDDKGGDGGQIQVFSTAGSFQRTILYEDPLFGPGSGFTVDGAGHIYFTDDDTRIIDSAGKATGKISYGRVDATDMGAIAGDPTGSAVYGRSNASLGEAILRFDGSGTELGKLDSPKAAGAFKWNPDRLAANEKGELIILDTYCSAAVVFRNGAVADAAYLAGLLTPGKKAALRQIGSDAAGDIFVLIAWGDGSFHVARIVPGSGSGNLPQKGCQALPGGATAGGGTTTGGGTTGTGTGASTLATTNPAKYSVPVQTFQNRRFAVAVTCPSLCLVAVKAAAVIGRKKYSAGSQTKRLTSGQVKPQMPKRTYNRLVRALRAGRTAKLKVSIDILYSDGSTGSKKLTLPLTPTRTSS